MGSILIVDDNLDGCRPLAKLLKHQGHRGICVGSGEEALAYLRSHRPDLVLLDVMMPDVDGYEVLRAVRRDPRTAHVPVIMFSAVAGEFIDRAFREGATDYWLKGTLGADLITAGLARHLSGRTWPGEGEAGAPSPAA